MVGKNPLIGTSIRRDPPDCYIQFRDFCYLSAEKSEFAKNSFFFTLREYITPIPERGSIADNTRVIEDSPLLIQREQSEAPANETG